MNKVLVVVDFQEDFVDDEVGVLGFPGASDMDDGILELVIKYHQNGDIIITTHDTHVRGEYENTTEGKILPIHTEPGTPGWRLFGKTGKYIEKINVINIDKITFPSLDLASMLKMLDNKFKDETGEGIHEVEFVGVDAAICVTSNIVMAIAALPSAKIKVYKKFIGSSDPEAKEAAIKVLKCMLVEVVE